jgi:hypothetical protein
MTSPDLHKTYIDDEHYNAGHGHAYEKYSVDARAGAVIIVRPDQREFAECDIQQLALITSRCFEDHHVGGLGGDCEVFRGVLS